ncbi:T9SS type A sorting domain-containing protein [Psychroflexus halocasei]|uniref:Por secretion system C-terminal sorting domain-containing protein n=1 Tax=Psychroflexus halocasei TaxID=908615 RepID=A0A1H4D1L0_9FLAO|nr:T9SS type A sorting domain-containing protein [Psychroflexus halocasei]SEA66604.1 Por secretion system C-terminal sorting domain-containing protein [Psychroflexus halocasei]
MKTNLLGYKYVYSFMLCVTMLFSYSISWGQGLEDFSNSNQGSSYSDNSFLGNNGITWSYVESRDGNGDENNSGINLPALMLRRSSDNSAVTSSSISGGIGNFSVKLYKGFTGGGNRQVELFVNGVSQGTSTPFDDFNEHVFTVNNINISGDITIEIRNITSKQIIVDDISWTAAAPTVGPQITNITTTPAGGITSSDAVTVNADVIDAAGIANVALKWGTTSGSLSNSLAMTNTTADVYEAIIPAQADGTTVYYALEAENTTGDTNTSTEMSYTVEDPVVVNLPYTVDATTVNLFTDGWTTQDLAGGNTWQYNTGSGVSMNAYSDNCDAEDWLITPAFDLSTTANELLSFELYENYSDTSIDVLYSTNYDGVSDPNTATWTNITTIQSGNSGVITDNISLQGLSANKVYVAFLYEGTGGSCSSWELTNFSLEEEINVIATTLGFTIEPITTIVDDVMSPAVSVAFTDASGNIDVSKNGIVSLATNGTFATTATTSVTAVNGVAVFDNLVFSAIQSGITLTATTTETGITGDTSATFDIVEAPTVPSLIFTEIADPSDIFEARFIEVYNNGSAPIDFNTTVVYLARYANGGISPQKVQLTGVLAAGSYYTVAYDEMEFNTAYGFDADLSSGIINGNGNDVYALYFDGDDTTGVLFDIYGEIGVDGSGEVWEYEDSRAVRNDINTLPNTVWTASEWTISPAATTDMTPGEGEALPADYTYTSGSWSPEDPNGMASPTDNIEVLDGTATFNNAIGINNLSIATGATLEVKDVLTVNGNITNDGNIIFKSTETKTAQLDEFNGTISGNGDVVVERFIPEKRAFRLLSSPVNGQTFADAWQQNTHITGEGGATNGFDPTPTNNPSLFIFNNSSSTQAEGAAWEAVTSTSDAISAGQGYRLMVRGDRTIDLTDQNATPTPTTLVSEGVLTTGNFTPTLAQAADFYSFVGNPYQAVVDFSALTFAGDIDDSRMYVWDPTLAGANGRGAYVTVDVNTNSPSPSSSQANKFIMPGQAFFVQNKSTVNQAPSITFTESAKTTSEVQTEIFSNVDEFYVNMRLYKQSALQNGETESDAIGLRFADYYTTPSSNEDASKLGNPGENFAVLNDKYTSIDNRAFPDENEEIQLFVSGYDEENYVIQFTMDHKPEDLEVILNDTYTDESLELSDAVNYVFNIDSNISESIASDRFYISFENVTMGTTQPDLANAIRLYPNPTEDLLTIDVNDFDVEQLKLYSIQGQELDSMTMPENNTLNVSHLNTGVYIIKIITNQGTSVQKFIKK